KNISIASTAKKKLPGHACFPLPNVKKLRSSFVAEELRSRR
ncbi:27791_t:CDS:1, partial [Gigaspora margarita]